MVSDTAFLAEVDRFLASCGVTPLLPSGAPTSGDKQTSSGETKSYYRIRRMERENLRRQVTELTAELNERLKAAEATEMHPRAKWMAIAKYYDQERKNAESEQRLLRAAIAARAALIQELFKVTQDRLSELGGMTQEEAQLMESGVGAAPYSIPEGFRADPLDSEIPKACIDPGLDHPDGAVDAFEFELEGEAWRDSGQIGIEGVDDLQNTNYLEPAELSSLSWMACHQEAREFG